MDVQAFATQPTKKFVRAVRRTANFWLFHHVPKTAGSSLAGELAELLQPYCNIHQVHRDDGSTPMDRLDQATQAFLKNHAEREHRSASGHLRLTQFQAIIDGVPNARAFTFLRDPVERTISEYRYMCTPQNPHFEQHLEKYPTIEHYVDQIGNGNRMVQYLCPVQFRNRGEPFNYVKSRYCFIGFVDDYNLSFQFLTLLMFAPILPRQTRANATKPVKANQQAISDQLRQKIADMNSVDYKLYNDVRKIYLQRREEMIALVEENRRG